MNTNPDKSPPGLSRAGGLEWEREQLLREVVTADFCKMCDEDVDLARRVRRVASRKPRREADARRQLAERPGGCRTPASHEDCRQEAVGGRLSLCPRRSRPAPQAAQG